MTRVVVALGGVGILVALVFTLSSPERLWLGTNGVPTAQFIGVIEEGDRYCQDEDLVPAGTGLVSMRIGTHGEAGSRVRIEFLDDGRRVLGGELAAGWPEPDISIPIEPPAQDTQVERVCLYNDGPARLAPAGDGGNARVEFHSAESRSWWSRYDIISDRYAAVRSSWLGGWSLPFAFLLTALAGGVAAFALLRRSR